MKGAIWSVSRPTYFVYRFITVLVSNTVVYLENAKRRQTRPQSSSSGRCWAPELSRRVRVLCLPYLLCGHFWIAVEGLKANCAADRLSFVADLQAQHDAILEWRSTSVPQSCERPPPPQTAVNTWFSPHCVVLKDKHYLKPRVKLIFWFVDLTSIAFMYFYFDLYSFFIYFWLSDCVNRWYGSSMKFLWIV